MAVCPYCCGSRESYTVVHYADSRHLPTGGWQPCSLCNGTGEVKQEIADKMERAEQRRLARIAKGVSLRGEAATLGITPRELSDLEQGRKE